MFLRLFYLAELNKDENSSSYGARFHILVCRCDINFNKVLYILISYYELGLSLSSKRVVRQTDRARHPHWVDWAVKPQHKQTSYEIAVMRYVVLWESPSFCQSISVIFLISYLGLFQENPPRWGGPENEFFLRGVCVGGGGGGGGGRHSFR